MELTVAREFNAVCGVDGAQLKRPTLMWTADSAEVTLETKRVAAQSRVMT